MKITCLKFLRSTTVYEKNLTNLFFTFHANYIHSDSPFLLYLIPFFLYISFYKSLETISRKTEV